MAECIWCQNNGNGYWECDGEGGECPPDPDDRPPLGCKDNPPRWEIAATRQLRYRNGDPVMRKMTDEEKEAQKKKNDGDEKAPGTVPIMVTIEAKHAPHSVFLNGDNVGHGTGTRRCGPRGPRPWTINRLVKPLRDKVGSVVLDQDGIPVRVRVQSYVYQYDSDKHRDDHCKGQGPKVRFYALKPGDPDCDPED